MMDVWESLELSRIKAQNQHLARSREDAFAQLDAADARIAELEAKIVALIKAGDRVAAACEVLARKLNDCTNEDLAEAVAAWTAWRREAKGFEEG